MKRALIAAVLVAVLLPTAAASAGAHKFTHATGGISMSGPNQHLTFAVFDYGATGDRGWVEYWNYDYPGGLHYTAQVTTVMVNAALRTATWTYTIPAGFPGLSGIVVTMYVTDGGSPGAGHDTYGHNGTYYPITAGNLVVHS
jgi:hypothetical protein